MVLTLLLGERGVQETLSAREKSTKAYRSQVEFDQPHRPTYGGRRCKGRNDRRGKMHPNDGTGMTRPDVVRNI